MDVDVVHRFFVVLVILFFDSDIYTALVKTIQNENLIIFSAQFCGDTKKQRKKNSTPRVVYYWTQTLCILYQLYIENCNIIIHCMIFSCDHTVVRACDKYKTKYNKYKI